MPSGELVYTGAVANDGTGSSPRATFQAINAEFSDRGVNPGWWAGTVTKTELEAAITSAGSGGTVYLGPGNHTVNPTVNLPAEFTLRGAGMDKTTITLGASGDLFHITGTGTTKQNITIEDMTIDGNDLASSALLIMEWVQHVRVRRVRFTGYSVWALSMGAYTTATETAYVVNDVQVEDCEFLDQTAGSTYEALLIFNAFNVTVSRCLFWNPSRTTGNGIGFYQKVLHARVDKCQIDGYTRGLYYSLSTDRISVTNSTIRDCAGGIVGANQSDNGSFGSTRTYRLNIDSCEITECGSGLQLGAVRDCTVTNTLVDRCDDAGCVIDDGNSPVSAQPNNITFTGCIFRDNNQSNTASVLHPGVLFQSVGGPQHVTFIGCKFYDDQTTPTQTTPITFTGNFTWDYITLVGCRLNPYSGGSTVALDSSAALGDNCQTIACYTHNGSLPAQLLETFISASVLYAGGSDSERVRLGPNVGPNGDAGIAFGSTDVLKIFRGDVDLMAFTADGSTSAMQLDDNLAASETAMLLQWSDGGTLKTQRVSVGATDSGGAGYRALRVPNA